MKGFLGRSVHHCICVNLGWVAGGLALDLPLFLLVQDFLNLVQVREPLHLTFTPYRE